MGGWALVIPVKRLAVAKSRLSDFAGAYRADLALAFAADTLAAARACPEVIGIAVVTDDESVAVLARSLGCRPVPDEPNAGLNHALSHGAAVANQQWPDSRLGAQVHRVHAVGQQQAIQSKGLDRRFPTFGQLYRAG